MQCKIRPAKKKKRILKTILTVFSRKEKAITRYTSKKLYFHCGPSTKTVET